MARIAFTSNLQRHVKCPPADVPGDSVAEVLGAYFKTHPDVRSYVLDERGSLRKHMAIYVSGDAVVDRDSLSDHVAGDAEIWVMQALSGG